MTYEITSLDVRVLTEAWAYLQDTPPKLHREFEALLERVKMNV